MIVVRAQRVAIFVVNRIYTFFYIYLILRFWTKTESEEH